MKADPSPTRPRPSRSSLFGPPASFGPSAFPRFPGRPIFLRAPDRVPVPFALPG
jgi:hypothetical protein